MTTPARVLALAALAGLASLASLALLTATTPAAAGEYTVFEDRASFEAALIQLSGSTVVDTGGAFAADPTASSGSAAITRSGTIAGSGAFSYDVYDLQFSNTPDGTLTPGVVGGDTGATSSIAVETPTAQGGAAGSGSWGVDSRAVSTSRRSGLLLDFTSTPGEAGVGHFGADLIDFEVEPGTPGELRLYAAGALVFSTPFDFGGGGTDGQVVFLGVLAGAPTDTFEQVAILVGDTSSQWAADRFAFGLASNPEPGTWALFGLGLGALGIAVRRRRRRKPHVPAPG